jgi:hypothetical protein
MKPSVAFEDTFWPSVAKLSPADGHRVIEALNKFFSLVATGCRLDFSVIHTDGLKMQRHAERERSIAD